MDTRNGAERPETETDTGEVRMVGDKYQIVRVRGRGGMGVVYEAENTWTRRRVALKVLAPGKESSPSRVQRFMAEARTAAQINHPNIVNVLDMGQDPSDGSLYIVQEWLDGEDLRERLRREVKLAADVAVPLVMPLLRALTVAHERGIVHRDIKPANIFLSRTTDGEVVPKIIDFGISKELGVQTSLVETETGQILGTPAYMSPEQLRGERPVGPSADVWAVGVVLYEMLAGALPFPATNYNVLVHAVLSGARVPLTTRVPALDPALAAIVHRAVEIRPEERFLTIRELHDALAAWRTQALRASGETPASGATVNASSSAPAPTSMSTSTPSAIELADTTLDPAMTRPRGWRLVVTVASVTAVFALVVAVARMQSPERPRLPPGRTEAVVVQPEATATPPPATTPPPARTEAPVAAVTTDAGALAPTVAAPAPHAHAGVRGRVREHHAANDGAPRDGAPPAAAPGVPSQNPRARPHTLLLTPGGSYPSQ